MNIEEIQRYAEQEIEAFDMMDDLEREEYQASNLAMQQLRMRQIILVASLAESLASIAKNLESFRVAGFPIENIH